MGKAQVAMARMVHGGVRRFMGDETCREATDHSNQNNIIHMQGDRYHLTRLSSTAAFRSC